MQHFKNELQFELGMEYLEARLHPDDVLPVSTDPQFWSWWTYIWEKADQWFESDTGYENYHRGRVGRLSIPRTIKQKTVCKSKSIPAA